MEVPVRRIFVILILCVLALAVLDAIPVLSGRILHVEVPVQLRGRVELGARGRGGSIPIWFSTELLAAVSATAFFIFHLEPKTAGRNLLESRYWLIVGLMFGWLSLDQSTYIHETFGIPHIKWTLVYALLLGAFYLLCVYYLFGIRKDMQEIRTWIIGGLTLAWVGAPVLNLVALTAPLSSEWLHIEQVLEQMLRMLGGIMVLRGCLLEFGVHFNRWISLRESSLMRVPVRRIFWTLIACVLALILVNEHFHMVHKYALRLDLASEQSIPNWFSTELLAATSALGFCIYYLEFKPASRNFVTSRFWLVFGWILAWISLEEMSWLHEALSKLGIETWFYYRPVMAALYLLCAYTLILTRKDAGELGIWIIGGMTLTGIGGVGLERFQHIEYLEESLELIGWILVLRGCLQEFNVTFNRRFFSQGRPWPAAQRNAEVTG